MIKTSIQLANTSIKRFFFKYFYCKISILGYNRGCEGALKIEKCRKMSKNAKKHTSQARFSMENKIIFTFYLYMWIYT